MEGNKAKEVYDKLTRAIEHALDQHPCEFSVERWARAVMAASVELPDGCSVTPGDEYGTAKVDIFISANMSPEAAQKFLDGLSKFYARIPSELSKIEVSEKQQGVPTNE